jgi:hypothetical protein
VADATAFTKVLEAAPPDRGVVLRVRTRDGLRFLVIRP